MHEQHKRRKSWREWLQMVAVSNTDVDIQSYHKPYIKYHPETADNVVYPRTVGGYWSQTHRKTSYSFIDRNRHNTYGYHTSTDNDNSPRSTKTKQCKKYKFTFDNYEKSTGENSKKAIGFGSGSPRKLSQYLQHGGIQKYIEKTMNDKNRVKSTKIENKIKIKKITFSTSVVKKNKPKYMSRDDSKHNSPDTLATNTYCAQNIGYLMKCFVILIFLLIIALMVQEFGCRLCCRKSHETQSKQVLMNSLWNWIHSAWLSVLCAILDLNCTV